jgi:hypothetical protein
MTAGHHWPERRRQEHCSKIKSGYLLLAEKLYTCGPQYADLTLLHKFAMLQDQ